MTLLKRSPGDCVANSGASTSSGVCCGQTGTVNDATLICSGANPTCIGYVYNVMFGKCGGIGLQCAADYLTPVNGPLCCGQTGLLSSAAYACPSQAPYCQNFRQGSAWGACAQGRTNVVSQCLCVGVGPIPVQLTNGGSTVSLPAATDNTKCYPGGSAVSASYGVAQCGSTTGAALYCKNDMTSDTATPVFLDGTAVYNSGIPASTLTINQANLLKLCPIWAG